MEHAAIKQANDLLFNTWMKGDVIEALPSACTPSSRAEGYAIQALTAEHSTKPLYGWKIAATSIAGQKHIGVDGPMGGRLIAERVVAEGSALSLQGNRMRVAECEFAFKMKHTLIPRIAAYSVKEVMDAVASLHPAIEIPDSRYAAFEKVGAPQLIADSACAHWFMLGKASTANWRSMNLATHAVTASVTNQGAMKHHHGTGANVLGDPCIALTWLVNELSQLGLALEAGQVVTTGTCIVPIAIKPGDDVRVSFGAIGEIEARFN